MLNFLKKFKKTRLTWLKRQVKKKVILITSLLIECAKEDGDFSEEEILKLKIFLIQNLDIKKENIDSIFDSALEISQESVEIYSLTKDIVIIFHMMKFLKFWNTCGLLC